MYEPYYKIARATNLPPDPRLKRYANTVGAIATIVCLVLVLWLGTLSYASHLHYRIYAVEERENIAAREGDSSLVGMLLLPVNVLRWELFVTTHPFRSPYLSQLVADATSAANGLMIIAGIFSSLVIWRLRYRALRDRSKLTTERGDDDWATPEDIAELGLFPDGYDVHTGFSRESRAEMAHQRRRSKNLKADRDQEEAEA